MAELRDLAPRFLRAAHVTYSWADVVAVALIAATVSGWAGVAGGAFSVPVLLACEVSFLCFYVVGALFASWSALAVGVLFDLPLRLLVGYAVVNTALLVLAVVSPLGIVASFGVVLVVATFAFVAASHRQRVAAASPSLIAVGIGLVATTLWCQDSIDPIVEREDVVVFKPWVDGFYHAVHVRIFAEGHGAWTLDDFRLAGMPARLYHYGVYLLPALIKQVAGVHSYTAFAGILAPVGVFFTGLAAYAFIGSLWGVWPGVTASMALLLLPDGAQQGMQNPFMSYHWLTQISPSATYGLALLAVAWLFVLRGCMRGGWVQLVFGWGVAGVLAAYKLHYVIASALLLLLVPALFFGRHIGARKRALWVVAAGSFYSVALAIGQHVPGVPLIRLDGSSNGEILRLVGSFALPGPVKEFLVQHAGPDFPWTANLLYGIPYVSLAALGAFAPLLLVLVGALRKRVPPILLLFPLLLIVNFVAMFFGLSLDFESSTPDELQHRPVMIVYFFVSAWVGGGLGLLLIESRRVARLARPAIVGMAAALTVTPATLGPGVQEMWVMPKLSPVRVPRAVVQVANHIRTHGDAEDLFQDSQFDRVYAIAALSERRPFVSHTLTRMPFRADVVATRSNAVNRLMLLRDPKLVIGTLRAYGIRWFVQHRGNKVSWPPTLTDHPALETEPLTLHDFR